MIQSEHTKYWRFELGGLPERELEKLKQEAERLGKGSFAFAFYMDRQKEERERGVTISCTTKESAGRISGVARTAGRVFFFRVSTGPLMVYASRKLGHRQ